MRGLDREVGQRIYAWFTLTNNGGQPLELEGIRLAIRGPGRVVRELDAEARDRLLKSAEGYRRNAARFRAGLRAI